MVLTSAVNRSRERFQIRRSRLFLELMEPAHGARVLDLGGGAGALAARIHHQRPDLRFTVADPEPTRLIARDRYGFDEVFIPHEGALPFRDGEFDIVLCNSVIEHATLPKEECLSRRFTKAEWREAAMARQARFADEVRRIAPRYFVQTPHRGFPFDVHTWLPFTGWLPHDSVRRLVTFTDKYWIKYCGVVDWHLLDERDMLTLFPGANITIERFAGLPKSLIAWR